MQVCKVRMCKAVQHSCLHRTLAFVGRMPGVSKQMGLGVIKRFAFCMLPTAVASVVLHCGLSAALQHCVPTVAYRMLNGHSMGTAHGPLCESAELSLRLSLSP